MCECDCHNKNKDEFPPLLKKIVQGIFLAFAFAIFFAPRQLFWFIEQIENIKGFIKYINPF